MRDCLVLLPGWGFAPVVLEPLAEALAAQAPDLEVRLEPLPASSATEGWLDALDRSVPAGAWLGGWSLGGMLAARLAARRGADCPGLVGLAANACFRARPEWPAAMPAEAFDTFCEAFGLDAGETLKRFSLLCARGGYDPRTLARQLQVIQREPVAEGLAAGLVLLAELDNRTVLREVDGAQLHLFGERDALVPAAAAEALAGWLPQAEVHVLAGASHAFPLERVEDAAAAILAFLERAR